MGKSSKHENKSKKKHKHKERKEKKKKSKKHLREKKKNKEDKAKKTSEEKVVVTREVLREEKSNDDDFAIPVELMNSKSYAPETPEEYQQRQNRIRREIDPVTGRSRLIKGDGEVLEEIVSKERHKNINKESTKGDGEFFQENTLGKLY